MLRTSHTLVLLALMAIGSPCYAMKAMTNDEIRQEIMKGALRNYEGGSCPAEYVMRPESPVQHSESKSQSSNQSNQNVTKEGTSSGGGIGIGPTIYGGGTGFVSSFVQQNNQSFEQHQGQSSGQSASGSTSYTEYPGVCTCPCPYSKDIKGKECGDSSVYFQYPDGDPNKIPCYPSDIKDWQITEYREQFDVQDPKQELPAKTAEPSDNK